MTAYNIKSSAHPNIFYEVPSFKRINTLSITVQDEHNNFISLDKANRQLYAQHTHGDIEPIPISIYATDYYSYSIVCKTLTVADVDAVEDWKYADFIRVQYVNQPNADVQKRIDAILVTMPHVEFVLGSSEF